MIYKDIDANIITHMLGYIKTEQWVEAINYYGLDKEQVIELVNIQDESYPGNILWEFLEELGTTTEVE